MRELVAPSTSRLTPWERLQAALDDLRRVSRGDAAALYVSDAGGRPCFHAAAGSATPPDPASASSGLVVRAWRESRAFVADPPESGEGPHRASPKVAVALPLFGTNGLLGVVRIDFTARPDLGADTLQELDGAVDRVGALLEVAHRADTPAPGKPGADVSARDPDLDRLKTRFLSMVSHELRTPLTAIIGYTDLLLRQIHGSLTERQYQHQVAVRKAADRLLSLINGLLDVTRLESGLVTLHPERLSLREAFDACLREAGQRAAESEVELIGVLSDERQAVEADRERLLQIIAILLENAIKFTPPGGSVTLSADQNGDTVRVSVSDTGLGVAPDEIVRVWDRLHQADSSLRRRFGGSGLGLAIVRHLVELHGGTVSAASDGRGQGSTFTFTLPLATGDRPSLSAPPDQRPPLPAAGAARRRRILIVDDDLDNRDVIASIVADVLGHEVMLAADGQQCLDRVEERPDLILLDLRMPDLDGFEVARRLKANATTARIPIVALTALADHDDQEAALTAGCAGCVTKPFTPANLGEAIARACGLAADQPATTPGLPTGA